ncbi:Uncharacterised protein [Mycobacteroides abscessus subsp. abscessus]|nr:Uncharacterised protein [Mycobacteroides abscessus subsp. abscessus]
MPGQRAGRGDEDADELADGLAAVALPYRQGEHRDVVAGVQPRVGLGQDVRAFEVRPAQGRVGGGLRGRHLGAVAGAGGGGEGGHQCPFRNGSASWAR